VQLKGKQVSVPGLELRSGGPTVLIALSSRCPFCSKSMPFYRRLSSLRREGKAFRLVVVSSEQSDTLKPYIAAEGVSVDSVLSTPLPPLGIRAVPTLLLLGSEGTVVGVWGGALGAAREREFLAKLGELVAAQARWEASSLGKESRQ
jgi:hypothetical protein